jgi:hypothetical protein
MTSDKNNVDVALEAYLARATPDPEWIALLRDSARQLLDGLAAAERDRFMRYISQFSVLNASFILRRVAAVHAATLFAQRHQEHGDEQTAAENLAAFRRDFIDPPLGEEEGKRPNETPLVVCKAGLRRAQGFDSGTPQAFQDMTGASIEKVMASFSAEERSSAQEQFETFSVEAMAQVFRLWMWHQGEESRRFITARQQYDQWHATRDESYWWRYPQGEEWIYF